MEDDEILVETSPVYLYNIPARLQKREGYMHRAADWDVQKPDWSGKIALVAAGPGCCHLQLEDNDGDVFAQAVIDSYPTPIIQPVLDSKRFFVLKIQKISGNYELAGIGYSTRQDSGLFMDTLEEYFTKPSTNPVPKRPSTPPKMVLLPPAKKIKVDEPSSSTVQQAPVKTAKPSPVNDSNKGLQTVCVSKPSAISDGKGSAAVADTTSQEGGESLKDASSVKPNPNKKVPSNNGSVVVTELEHVIQEPAAAVHTDQVQNGANSNPEQGASTESKKGDSISLLDKPGSSHENSTERKQESSDASATKTDLKPKAKKENEDICTVKSQELEPITSSTDDAVPTENNDTAQATSSKDPHSNRANANQSQETGDYQSAVADTTVAAEGALDILDTEEQAEMDATYIDTLQPPIEALATDADPLAATEECMSDTNGLEIVDNEEIREENIASVGATVEPCEKDTPNELVSSMENNEVLVAVDKINSESVPKIHVEQQKDTCEDAPMAAPVTEQVTSEIGRTEEEATGNQPTGHSVVPCDTIDAEQEVPNGPEEGGENNTEEDVQMNETENVEDNFEQEDEQYNEEEQAGEENQDFEEEQDGEEFQDNEEEFVGEDFQDNEEEFVGEDFQDNEEEFVGEEILDEEEQTGEETQGDEEELVGDELLGEEEQTGEETQGNEEELVGNEILGEEEQEQTGEETQDKEEQEEGVTKPRVTLMISLPKGYRYQDEVGGPFKCHKCPQTFDGYNLIQRHWATVHKFKQTGHCSICLLPFPNRSEVADHRKRVHGFTCEECGRHFKKEIGLKDHQKNSHGLTSAHICPYCPNQTEFKLKNQLIKHIQSKHENVSESPILFTCTTCNERFLSEAELEEHGLKHQNALACPHCDQKFKGPRGVSKRFLNTHIAEVHPDVAPQEQPSPRRTSNRLPRRN